MMPQSLFPERYGPASLYAVFLLFLFFVPTFAGVLRQGNLYVGAILQVAYTALFLVIFASFMFRRPIARIHFLATLLIPLVFFIIIALAGARDVHRTIPADLLELHKPVFIFIILLTTFLITWDDAAVRRVANAYLVIVAGMAFYSIFEVFGGTAGHAVSTLLYKSAKPVLAGKATGTFGQTYVYGAFMIFGFLLAGATFLYTRRLRYLGIALAAVATMVLSQSRSAALAFVFMSLCTIAAYGFYKNTRSKAAVYGMAIVGIGLLYLALDRVLVVFQDLPYLYSGVSRLLARGVDADGVGSFNERYQQLLFAVESQDAIPLLGVGIGKGYTRLLESYYALYLFRYGAIGIMLSVVVFIIFFRSSLMAFNRSVTAGEWLNASFFIALHLWMYAFPILALSSAFHDQGKFAVFFYGALAITCSYNYHKRRTSADARAATSNCGQVHGGMSSHREAAVTRGPGHRPRW